MGTIAILDSGIGGLSVYQEIVKKCPEHHYVFVSDNDAFPYGTKTETFLIERVLLLVEGIVSNYKPDILVIACNTASTVVLPALRAKYDFPIVGVVPAIKPAASLTKSKVIGLLATPGTIRRAYTQDLIDRFAQDCHIIKLGSNELVEIAESKLYKQAVDVDQLEAQLAPLLSVKELDTLVLACTHFPFLSAEIDAFFKAKGLSVKLIDSGSAIANRVSDIIGNKDSFGGVSKAIFTSQNQTKALADYLEQIGLTQSSEKLV